MRNTLTGSSSRRSRTARSGSITLARACGPTIRRALRHLPSNRLADFDRYLESALALGQLWRTPTDTQTVGDGAKLLILRAPAGHGSDGGANPVRGPPSLGQAFGDGALRSAPMAAGRESAGRRGDSCCSSPQ